MIDEVGIVDRRWEEKMARRPQTTQTGIKAVNLVREVLNELNWVSNPLSEDFGIDLHVKVFESTGQRRALPWEFYVQVKGTTRLACDKESVRFNIDTQHLRDWSESRLPVLLVVCDVIQNTGYWLFVNEYLENLDDDWEEKKSLTLGLPQRNQLTRDGLVSFLGQIKRASFIKEAPAVIAFMETPSEDHVYDEHFWPSSNNPYRQSLAAPDVAIRDLALARCILCYNYFWIDENLTAGHDRIDADDELPANLDFTQIYGPRSHEPAVYSCDSPEEFCPFCTTGCGALAQCQQCGKFKVQDQGWLEDWNDPLITKEEAQNTCGECLEGMRERRKPSEVS